MRRYSPGYYSPPRRGYGGRGRSPPRRGYGGRKDQKPGSLLVRNIPLNCRAEELRVPFERFGPIRDVYIPKDYYSGEARGFAFVQFVDPFDASEAQYHMNRQIFGGREITVVVATEMRKRPEEMRRRTRSRAISAYDGGRSSYHGHSRSRSNSRSPSPRRPSNSRIRHRSRSYSPKPKPRDDDDSASPRRQSAHSRSPRGYPQGRGEKQSRRSYSPKHTDGNRKQADHGDLSESPRGKPRRQSRSPTNYQERYGENQRLRSYSLKNDVTERNEAKRNDASYDYEKEPRRPSYSPSGSRSRSIDLSPGQNR